MTSTAMAAARLLREYAEELKRSHTIFSSGAWPEGESEAKAAYEQHIAIASALEAMPAKCLHQIQEPTPVLVAQPQLHAALFAARGALQHMKEGGKPIQSLLNEAIAAIDSVAVTQAAPAAVAVPDAVRDADKLLRAEAARLARIYGSNKWYGFSAEKESYLEHLRAAAALAATPAAAPAVLPEPAMNEEGYLPCPFCGSDQVSLSTGEVSGGQPWHYVECESCTATAEPEKWNERALLASAGKTQTNDSDPLSDFQEGQWWVNELDAMASHPIGQKISITPDLKRSVSVVHNLLRALPATGGQAQAVEQAPILYVSKGQLDNHSDPDGPDSANAGRYLPCRITPAGKFTTPLFAAPQGQAGARDAGTFEQRMSDWSQEDAIDAERYRFIVEHKLILSGGAKKFGWAIAPFGVECHRYIDAARAAIAAVKGE